jgi:hypothetical protein
MHCYDLSASPKAMCWKLDSQSSIPRGKTFRCLCQERLTSIQRAYSSSAMWAQFPPLEHHISNTALSRDWAGRHLLDLEHLSQPQQPWEINFWYFGIVSQKKTKKRERERETKTDTKSTKSKTWTNHYSQVSPHPPMKILMLWNKSLQKSRSIVALVTDVPPFVQVTKKF